MTDYADSKRFGSWREYVEVADAGKIAVSGASHAHGDKSGGYYYFPSYPEAHRVAFEGWKEIRDEINAMVDDWSAEFDEVIEKVTTPSYNFWGSAVDVGRYCGGEPECMVEFLEESMPTIGRILRVGIEGWTSAAVSTDILVKRGAAILALCNVLVKIGVVVEITVEYNSTNSSRGAGKKCHVEIPVKLSDEMWDVDALAFNIANPDACRRIHWAYQEGLYGRGGLGGFYGYPSGMEGTYDVKFEKSDWLDSGPGQSRESAIAWIRRMLTNLGIN